MFKRFLTAFAIIMLFTLSFSQQVGKASWYGNSTHHGKKTASGDIFDQNALTGASNIFPLRTKLRLTNVKNNKSVEIIITDRGGFSKYGRLLDLSKGAFSKIANVKQGLVTVMIEVIEQD